ncbi:hypothetical protein PINS_up004289 [Pythium insidiosum]|nr:hypothetical protein PINS_up004289 [Pythium insidiosum]
MHHERRVPWKTKCAAATRANPAMGGARPREAEDSTASVRITVHVQTKINGAWIIGGGYENWKTLARVRRYDQELRSRRDPWQRLSRHLRTSPCSCPRRHRALLTRVPVTRVR